MSQIDDAQLPVTIYLSGDTMRPFIDYMRNHNTTFTRCTDGLFRINRRGVRLPDHVHPNGCGYYMVTFAIPPGRGLDGRMRVYMDEVSDLITEIEYVACGYCLVEYGADLGYFP